jgi:hypothetical protein
MSENLKYISGGLLGDFIYQLSVIKENYLLSGKKGELFLVDKIKNSSCWKFGVEKAYNDLKDIVLNQDYISSFEIYNNIDDINDYINLSSWYDSSLLFKTNFYEIFKKEYDVEWGSHKWLDLPKNEKYKDYVLISTSEKSERYNHFFDFNILYAYNKKIYYATTNIKEYEIFKIKSNCNFELLLFDNLIDFWIAINSCYLFVSMFSSFLCLSNALHKNTIALLPDNDDLFMFRNIPNLKWYVNDFEHNLHNTPLLYNIYLKIQNDSEFKFIYIKDENKLKIATIRNFNAKVRILDHNKILIYSTIIKLNDVTWYAFDKNIYDTNEFIIIEIKDMNDSLIIEKQLILQNNKKNMNDLIIEDITLQNNIKEFFEFSYEKNNNRLHIYCSKKIDVIVSIFDDINYKHYTTITNFNNNKFWYSTTKILNNIKIEIKDLKGNLILEKYMTLQLPKSKILKLKPNLGLGDLLIFLSYIKQHYDEYDKFQIVFDYDKILFWRNNSESIKKFTKDIVDLWFNDPKIEILDHLEEFNYAGQIENYNNTLNEYFRPVKLTNIFDDPYICIGTKIRVERYDNYLSFKDKFLEALSFLSKKYKIVIMGTTNNTTEEMIKAGEGQFLIYEDLINNIDKNNIIDLTRVEILHDNNIGDFYKDAMILKNSEFTTFIGGGGFHLIAMSYAKKVIGFRSYGSKDTDNYLSGKLIDDEKLFLTNDIDLYIEKLKNN